jgi:hypothetical protein
VEDLTISALNILFSKEKMEVVDDFGGSDRLMMRGRIVSKYYIWMSIMYSIFNASRRFHTYSVTIAVVLLDQEYAP